MLLDNVDKQILHFLLGNARTPYLQIAKSLNISESTVRKRVAKLREDGIIRGFTVELDQTLAFQSIVAVKARPKLTKKVVSLIKEFNPFMPVVEVTGSFDIFCRISAPTARELNEKIDKIRDLSGVVETQSFLVVNKT